MPPLRFNFKELIDLNEDLTQSPKALRAIVSKVMAQGLGKLRNQMKPGIPRRTGKLAASFGSPAIRKLPPGVLSKSIFGFLYGKKISAATAIAGNVLQRPGATAKKSQNLWIPIAGNRSASGGGIITPQAFFAMPDTFIQTTPSGKKMAFQRSGNSLIPLFVLQKTVVMPMHPLNIESNVEGRVPEIIEDTQRAFGEVLAAKGEVIRQANSGG